MDERLTEVLRSYGFEEQVISCSPYGSGHINETYLAELADGKKVIVQRISERLTKDAAGLMHNISLVTSYLREREPDPRRVMELYEAKDQKPFVSLASGNWRAYAYIEDTICLQAPESDEDFRQSAIAFGRFSELLGDFPAGQLIDTIPDFHNTPMRVRQLADAVEKDPAGRKDKVEKEIRFIFEREERMGILQRMRDAGELPVRVTHNDTKLDNVLFDRKTRKALCVIDLDTVMPGLSLYDFGDSIRFGAATAREDEKDLSKMELDLHKYEVYLDGYLEACPGLTPKEMELLPLGALTITLEQAARFLTDYLNGDVYYRTVYPGQNLDRCRTQMKLAADMERKLRCT